MMQSSFQDILIEIDTVPSESGRTVPPVQVARMRFGGPVATCIDPQRVVWVVTIDVPVGRDRRSRTNRIFGRHWIPTPTLLDALHGSAARGRGDSVERADPDAVLQHRTEDIRRTRRCSVTPAMLWRPSSNTPAAIIRVVRGVWWDTSSSTPTRTVLLPIRRTNRQTNAMTVMMQIPMHAVAVFRRGRATVVRVVAPRITGTVLPMDGDATDTRLWVVSRTDPWVARTSGVISAVAHHRYGYHPPDGDIDDLIGTQLGDRSDLANPLPAPLPAVTCERGVLLLCSRRARAEDHRRRTLRDRIDAMAMHDAVGVDPHGLLAVLADTPRIGLLDPHSMGRLAALRCGQTVPSDLPSVAIPSAWHTPPPLRTWRETTSRHVTASLDASLPDRLDAPYPTGAPDVTMVRPTTKRRACLAQVFFLAWIKDIRTFMARAATPAAMAAIRATLPHAKRLPPDKVHALQALIDTDRRRPS